MRHKPEVPKSHAKKEYRIRFKTSPMAKKVFGCEVVTARPGVIKNNRPKAERYLKNLSKQLNCWLEMRETPDSEWKKI